MILGKIIEIRKECSKSLYYNNRGRLNYSRWKIILFYYCIPLLISITLLLLNQKLTASSITYFITGISIFAGLFFNLLIVVSEKMDKRKSQLNSTFEPTKLYAEDYRKFSEGLISSISYAIILSFFIIIFMFLTQVKYDSLSCWLSCDKINNLNDYSEITFNFLSYFIGIKFIILLQHVLIGMYDMLIHDMNLNDFQQ